MTYYGFVIRTPKSNKIPTMGKFCIGFAFLKVDVHPTADIFTNPFPGVIWMISIIVIISGHVLLKFQLILQKKYNQIPRKIGIHEWIYLDVDEDLRLGI